MRVLLLVVTACVAGCMTSAEPRPDTTSTNSKLSSIQVTPATVTLSVGDTTRLSALPRDANGKSMTGVTITWTSPSPSVTVDPAGLLRGVSSGGPITVTASSGSVVGSTAVTITAPSVGSFLVSPDSPSIAESDSVKLTGTIKDKNGNPLSLPVTWGTTGTLVLVDQTGWVKSIGGTGSATVTASIQPAGSGKISTSVTVAITSVPLAPGVVYFGANRSAFAGGPSSREINGVSTTTLVETNLTANPSDDDFPSVSPNGQYLWFYTNRFVQKGEYVVMKKDGSGTRRIFTGCQWNDGGPLFGYCALPRGWLSDSRLIVQVIDKSLPNLLPINTTTTLHPGTGASQAFNVSPDATAVTYGRSGTMGYSLSGSGILEAVKLVDGARTRLANACTFTSACTLADWSPDEKAVYAFREGSLYRFPIDGSPSTKMYTASATVTEMVVSPDGLQLAFIEGDFLRVIPTGSGAAKGLSKSLGQLAWSPDSKSIAFTMSEFDNGIPNEVWGINVTGTGKRKLVSALFLRGVAWGQ